jgi:hypothetical protein
MAREFHVEILDRFPDDNEGYPPCECCGMTLDRICSVHVWNEWSTAVTSTPSLAGTTVAECLCRGCAEVTATDYPYPVKVTVDNTDDR